MWDDCKVLWSLIRYSHWHEQDQEQTKELLILMLILMRHHCFIHNQLELVDLCCRSCTAPAVAAAAPAPVAAAAGSCSSLKEVEVEAALEANRRSKWRIRLKSSCSRKLLGALFL
jgi:hypothetical protein